MTQARAGIAELALRLAAPQVGVILSVAKDLRFLFSTAHFLESRP
jgi:hypothetical protein